MKSLSTVEKVLTVSHRISRMETEELNRTMAGTRKAGVLSAKASDEQGSFCASAFLGGGEMGRRIRAFDWAHHPLGEPASWPKNLRVALNICLASRFPMILYWGRSLRVFYNDAYIPIFGTKHPDVLGRTCAE